MKLRTLTIAFLIFSAHAPVILHAQQALYPNEFPAADVRLLDGPFLHARDLNINTILQYDTDRLLAGFRKEAGLPAKALSYPNWDGLDGHVGGHYLSALAMNYASTGNAECGSRLLYMIAELKACAAANNRKGGWATGYIGAVPGSEQIWTGFIKGHFAAFQSAWVPFYNIHKTCAGLRDAWLYTHNDDAKNLFLALCDWSIAITANLDESQMQQVLNTEHGGMNEVLADAYQITGDSKYMQAAKKYSHHLLLDAMTAGIDNLDNKHANTQVPKAVGFERIGELSNDTVYTKAGTFFWQTVVTNRTLAFGGNSRREFFPSQPASNDYVNDVEGPETCNSYNMLKLTETAFRMDPQARYADFYERTLYNHILSTQHPTHGGYVYFTPARPRHYRVYSSPNEGMWCCVGSGMENHSRYGQFIYTHKADSLFVNLFVASTLNWKEKRIELTQQTSFPLQEHSTITVNSGTGKFSLLVRYPGWVTPGKLKIEVNGKTIRYNDSPSSYIAIKRIWKKGDVVKIYLPMTTRIEQMPGLPSYIAFMHGPVLLSAKTDSDSLPGLVANDGRWAHIASGDRLPIGESPIIIDDNRTTLADRLQPVAGKPLHYRFTGVTMINTTSGQNANSARATAASGSQSLQAAGQNARSSAGNTFPLELQPFYTLHDSRYMMYWMALDNKGYRAYLDSFATIEKQQLELQRRTVDMVAPGEQQPEADHFIKQEHSSTGNQHDEMWRSASEEGFFSYDMQTAGLNNLSLMLKFWGAEWGSRRFEICIDDELLIAVDNTDRWNQSAFQQVTYPIPASMLEGKNKITVKIKAVKGSTAGPVYSVRLVRPQ